MNPEIGIELTCGKEGVNLRRARRDRERLQDLADRFHIRTYFEESVQDGIAYLDAYIYPTPRLLLAVLDALDATHLGYDNIDLPPELDGTPLHRQLRQRYRHGGVMVNV
jgi:hypothetical protein